MPEICPGEGFYEDSKPVCLVETAVSPSGEVLKQNLCVFVCFQETEEDLAESEEYKEARGVLDSVKLEG